MARQEYLPSMAEGPKCSRGEGEAAGGKAAEGREVLAAGGKPSGGVGVEDGGGGGVLDIDIA